MISALAAVGIVASAYALNAVALVMPGILLLRVLAPTFGMVVFGENEDLTDLAFGTMLSASWACWFVAAFLLQWLVARLRVRVS